VKINIEADEDVSGSNSKSVNCVVELHRAHHAMWRIANVCSKQTGKMMGQGGVTDGAHNGQQIDPFLVDFRVPVQPGWPRTLWRQVLDDLLRK
jgi:hypothetical protein